MSLSKPSTVRLAATSSEVDRFVESINRTGGVPGWGSTFADTSSGNGIGSYLSTGWDIVRSYVNPYSVNSNDVTSNYALHQLYGAVRSSIKSEAGDMAFSATMAMGRNPIYGLSWGETIIAAWAHKYSVEAGVEELLKTFEANAGYTHEESDVEKIRNWVDTLKDVRSVAKQASGLRDPIIFDIDGDGVEIRRVSDGIAIDSDMDGYIETVAWVSPQDGVLVSDRNYNGIIDNFSEVFSEYFAGGDFSGALAVTCSGTFIRLKVEPRVKLRRRARFGQWGQAWSPVRAESLPPLP